MLSYLGRHAISANRMAPQNATELSTPSGYKRIDRSKETLKYSFFLSLCEIRTMNESFAHVHGYCCRDQAACNVGKIRFTRTASSFVRPCQNWARTTNDNYRVILFAKEVSTRKSHKKNQSCIFDEPNYVFIYIHRKPLHLSGHVI